LLNPPVGWRIEPVYATLDQSYRYARKFTTTFLDVQNEGLNDDPIDFASGDIFFAMDLRPEFQSNYADYYQYLRCRGLKVEVFYPMICSWLSIIITALLLWPIASRIGLR